MRMIHQLLAALAVIAAMIAALLGSAEPPLAEDEISALQLARWIVDRRPGVQLLDLREQAAFDRAHLPGALPRAEHATAPLSSMGTLVVYAEHSITRNALHQLAVAPGGPALLRLRGGIHAWSQQILFPTIRSNASDAERRAFDQQARLSRYFGGSPRVLEPGARIEQPRSRRGC